MLVVDKLVERYERGDLKGSENARCLALALQQLGACVPIVCLSCVYLVSFVFLSCVYRSAATAD